MFGCCYGIFTSRKIITHVISSTMSSSSYFHLRYESLTTASAAFSAFLHSKYGMTIFAISSFERNSQTPSLARTINLSSGHRSSSRISKQINLQIILTWLCGDSNSRCNFVSEWPCHSKTWNVLSLQPHSERPDWIVIRVSERVNPSSILIDSGCLISLARLLVSWNGLSNNLTCYVSCFLFDDDSTRIANIGAEEFLAHGENSDAGRPTESDVEHAREKLFIAVKERIVKSNAHLIRVKLLLLASLLEIFFILLHHNL